MKVAAISKASIASVLKWVARIPVVVAAGCCFCVTPFIWFAALDGAGSPKPYAGLYALIIAGTPVVVATFFVFVLIYSDKRVWFLAVGSILNIAIIGGIGWGWAKINVYDLPTSPPALANGHDFRVYSHTPTYKQSFEFEKGLEWTAVL